jgi:citrate lyase subunit beta/citryl-CoA lyase
MTNIAPYRGAVERDIKTDTRAHWKTRPVVRIISVLGKCYFTLASSSKNVNNQMRRGKLMFVSHPFPLFVPADRPERFAKAIAARPDAVLIDLEDAVARRLKVEARGSLVSALHADELGLAILLRINAEGDAEHDADLAVAADLPLAGIVLPKTERVETIKRVAAKTGKHVIALVETARGLANVEAIAENVVQIAFGSIDFAADLAMQHTQAALHYARARIVLASRLAGIAAPLDGVTTAVHDADIFACDCAHSLEMGFGGKLLIHPNQISLARRAFAPSEADVTWAHRVLTAEGAGAALIDGAMVDAPVFARARQVLARHALAATEDRQP